MIDAKYLNPIVYAERIHMKEELKDTYAQLKSRLVDLRSYL